MARGAVLGAAGAAVYAAAGYVAVVGAPRWLDLPLPAPRLHPGFVLLLFAVYVALGAGVGALSGLVARSATALAVLALVLLHAAHLVRTSAPDAGLFVALGVCAVVVAVLAVVASSSRAARRLRFVANPWSASLIVVGASTWIFESGRHATLLEQVGVALGWTLGVAGVSLLCAAVLRPGGREPRPLPALAAGAVAVLAALGLGARLQRPSPLELPPPPASVEARPDVVLITLDTVRSDHLSVYGYERDTTPNLLDFAKGATLYERAVSASNLTLPTHASLFTGLYPRHHGAYTDPRLGAMRLSLRFRTLAEILHDAGYLTVAVVANPGYLASRLGFGQGFDHYDEAHPPPFVPELRAHYPARSLADALEAADAEPPEQLYRPAAAINRAVFGVLDAVAGRRQPLFLFVNYMDAHAPYEPPPPFDERYPGRLDGAARPGRDDFRAVHYFERKLTPAERDHYVSQYDGELAYLDSELARLFGRLRELGRWEDALVVVTADHGEALGDHGLLAHGISLHQDQVHVPLLVKYPGQQQGVVSKRLTSSVDLLPTILGVVGLEPAAALPGVDLRGPEPSDRAVISEMYPGPRLARSSPQTRHPRRALLAGDLKLIASQSGARLFDLSSDPKEERDLGAGDARAAELERRLDAWLASRPAERGEMTALDPETQERLRALGYAE